MKKIIICIITLLMVSCDNSFDSTIYAFIGDSEIDRWDIKASFPTLLTENHGLGGTGLDYIQSKRGSMKGKTVIVQFGTNDLKLFDDTYAQQYVSAVEGLMAEGVYLISMFPRNIDGEGSRYNPIIEDMNHQIEKLSSSYGWHYINVFPLLMDEEDLNWNYYTDGLHLSSLGYELVSNELRKALR